MAADSTVSDDAPVGNTVVDGLMVDGVVQDEATVGDPATDDAATPVSVSAHPAGDRGRAVHRYRGRCAREVVSQSSQAMYPEQRGCQ